MTDGGVESIFNAIHDTYDNVMTVQRPAERLVEYAKLAPGQRVLDVACGTGFSTMPAARAVGDTGRVIGIDIADKLLDVARGKTISADLSNVEYRVGDAEALDFDDASFDAVICALSIFFLRDILKTLHEWHRVLKVGGKLAFSSFGPYLLQPFGKLFHERMAQYDEQPPPDQRFIGRTDTPDKCRELLENAGFEDIDVTAEQLGFYFQDTADYWQEISSGVYRLFLGRLSHADLERFKEEHLAEVETLRTDQGIWNDVPVLFSVAIKRS